MEFLTARNLTHGGTLLLSSMALIFIFPMLFGAFGQVPWSQATAEFQGDDFTLNIGLLATWGFRSDRKGTIVITQYNEDTCDSLVEQKTCDKCRDGGGAVFAFTFFALLTTTILILLQYARFFGSFKLGNDNLARMIFSGLYGWTSFCLFLCWTIWVGECHQKMKDDDNLDRYDVVLSSAWSLCFLAFIFTLTGASYEFLLGNQLNSAPSKTTGGHEEAKIEDPEEKNQGANNPDGNLPSAPEAQDTDHKREEQPNTEEQPSTGGNNLGNQQSSAQPAQPVTSIV